MFCTSPPSLVLQKLARLRQIGTFHIQSILWVTYLAVVMCATTTKSGFVGLTAPNQHPMNYFSKPAGVAGAEANEKSDPKAESKQ